MKTTHDAINGPDMTEILMTLGSFLSWAEQSNAMYGGHSASEAIVALQHLLGWDDARMKTFIEILTQ